MTDTTLPQVRDDPGHNRFVLELDGHVGELQYLTQPGRLILVHTEVPEELGGRGVGGALVRAAVERARTEQRTIVPWCPFARRWLQQHEDVAATVAIDWDTPRPAR